MLVGYYYLSGTPPVTLSGSFEWLWTETCLFRKLILYTVKSNFARILELHIMWWGPYVFSSRLVVCRSDAFLVPAIVITYNS